MAQHTPLPGIVQWFPFESRELVTEAVRHLTELRITELRLLFSWADWEREGGSAWFDWFVAQFGTVPNLRLLPSLFYTPPHLAMSNAEGKQFTSNPPRDLTAYAKFVRTMIERYGTHFDWIQIWNEPNWQPYWDWNLDPTGELFAKMATGAAETAHALGKKVLLGGTTPLDYAWFVHMERLGLLAPCDALSFHYSPSWVWDEPHRHWMALDAEIAAFRALLKGFGLDCEIWLDESGVSTNTRTDHDEHKLEQLQIHFFDELCRMPVERVYWYCLFDQKPDTLTDDAINVGMEPDPTAYYFGIVACDGRQKPLYDHWKDLAESTE